LGFQPNLRHFLSKSAAFFLRNRDKSAQVG
jgi:hypothetical protein